jgi:hypothetical protein
MAYADEFMAFNVQQFSNCVPYVPLVPHSKQLKLIQDVDTHLYTNIRKINQEKLYEATFVLIQLHLSRSSSRRRCATASSST